MLESDLATSSLSVRSAAAQHLQLPSPPSKRWKNALVLHAASQFCMELSARLCHAPPVWHSIPVITTGLAVSML